MQRLILYLYTFAFMLMFALRSIWNRGRGTHTLGVGGKGTFTVIDKPEFPLSPFFKPGATLSIQIRHATALRKDEAEKDFRSISLKFSTDSFKSPLDLIMNTGKVQGFWHAANFMKGAIGGALGVDGRRWYIENNPPAFENVQAGNRRSPDSYANLHYYAALTFDYITASNEKLLCRFRIIPSGPGSESGIPIGDDFDQPWAEKRLAGETRPANYLRREYQRRIASGIKTEYRLQIQIHKPDKDDGNDIYNIGREWDEATHPWMDVGMFKITSAMNVEEAERLRFRVNHLPPSIKIPKAESAVDYRSIGWMRVQVYPVEQAVRTFISNIQSMFGFGSAPAWDYKQLSASLQWRRPETTTIFANIQKDKVESLRLQLKRAKNSLNLDKLTNLHFFRMFILDEEVDVYGCRHLPCLVISIVYDGHTLNFLDDLIATGGDTFRAIFENCVNYPVKADGSAFRNWLLSKHKKPNTYHIGGVLDKVSHIREEDRLHIAVESFIDEQMAAAKWKNKTPEFIRSRIQHFVKTRADLPHEERPKPPLISRFLKAFAAARVIIMLSITPALLSYASIPPARHSFFIFVIASLAIFASMLLLAIVVVRFYEIIEPDDVVKPKPGQVADLAAQEDHFLQNQFTMITTVRNSAFRRLAMRVVLWIANTLSSFVWNGGKLVGIDSIHFARLHQLNEGRRMLFISDYDGSWDRYLFDFLGVGAFAVVPIWANLHGCPKTRFLLQPTKGFAQRFLPFTRAKQVESQIWHSAYSNLTMEDVKRNAKIRKGLFGSMNARDVREWLRLFKG